MSSTLPPFRLGTRKSALALTQSKYVQKLLAEAGAECTLVEVDSTGDKDKSTPLYHMETSGTPGFFTKELEQALLAGTIDLAVHSLKDLPTDQPAGLLVGSIPHREITDDSLIINDAKVAPGELLSLPQGAVVGTSSLRREAQLLAQRPDLKITPIRGNVPTRVRLAREGKVDAVVLAEAGLTRLGLAMDGVTRVVLPADTFVPAPGQGALGVEIRHDCPEVLLKALRQIHNARAARETRVERAVLKGLHGGCSLPLGVRCESQAQSNSLKIKAFLGLLAPLTKEGHHRWISFHDFDIRGEEDETLVGKIIAHFKEVIDVQP